LWVSAVLVVFVVPTLATLVTLGERDVLERVRLSINKTLEQSHQNTYRNLDLAAIEADDKAARRNSLDDFDDDDDLEVRSVIRRDSTRDSLDGFVMAGQLEAIIEEKRRRNKDDSDADDDDDGAGNDDDDDKKEATTSPFSPRALAAIDDDLCPWTRVIYEPDADDDVPTDKLLDVDDDLPAGGPQAAPDDFYLGVSTNSATDSYEPTIAGSGSPLVR